MKKKLILLIGIISLLLFTRVDAATEMPEEVNGTITLTENVTLDSTFTVSDGEDITLNLNGYTLTTTSSTPILVEEGGTLTITGNGTITYGSDEYVIQTYGELTIESGTFNGQIMIRGTGSIEINGGTFTGLSGNYPTLYIYGIAVINDGTFTGESSVAVYGVSGSDITINGGTFTSEGLNVVYGTSSSNIEINGGTFTGKGSNYPTLYIYGTAVINDGTFTSESSNVVYGTSSSNIEINGGTFTSESSNVVYGTSSSDITINGGTFDEADDKILIQIYGYAEINEGNFYGQVSAENGGNIEINGGTYYFDGSGSTAVYVATNSTLKINGGTINCSEDKYAVRVVGKIYISNGNINGRISVESGGTLEITGGIFVNDSDDEYYNYLISNTSSNTVTISGGTYTYPSVLLSSDSTETAEISGSVTGPLELNSYAVSGAIITLNESVDSEETLEITEGVTILVPPTVSFKIKDITGDGTIDVTDDRYEIVYVDGYYIMRLKEVVEDSSDSEEETTANPNTGIETPYVVGLILIISSVILMFLYRKKRYM